MYIRMYILYIIRWEWHPAEERRIVIGRSTSAGSPMHSDAAAPCGQPGRVREGNLYSMREREVGAHSERTLAHREGSKYHGLPAAR